MIVTRDANSHIHATNAYLHQQFEMKDLGTLFYFLGVEIFYSSRGQVLIQEKYASTVLHRVALVYTEVVACRPTPLEPRKI